MHDRCFGKCYSHSCTKRNGGKIIHLSCGLSYERRSKPNRALIAGMDPENSATEVEQLRPYARICSILEHIYKIRVLRVDGSKCCCTLYLIIYRCRSSRKARTFFLDF